uniref:Uncharacterized protein n=1 Tax=Globisporangium ultimum (strain ATCC 200006 / CBS 805.95 / DAOM BR144) TaxID=431595 RepID=K3WRU3_GLOUD
MAVAAPPLLFSMQFYLNDLSLFLTPTHSSAAQSADASAGYDAKFLVGFQLLQYEIVLFDPVDALSIAQAAADNEQELSSSNDGDVVAMKLQHGKSCLFEANADHLAMDLQRECEAPLTLLVMQQDHGKARLVAFASIPIELHVGLFRKATEGENGHETVSMQTEMRFRVCEWASSSGTWELKDHANQVVGSATGAVTLSCLGQALTPHLVHAIGLQADKCVQSRSTSPTRSSMEKVAITTLGKHTDETTAVGDRDDQQHMRSAKPNDDAMDSSKTSAMEKQKNAVLRSQTAEIAVQCDEGHLYGNGDDRTYFACHSASPIIRIEGKKSTPKTPLSDCIVRQTRPAVMHDEHKRRRNGNARHSREALTSSVLTRDLPPPLFFQKPKSKKS